MKIWRNHNSNLFIENLSTTLNCQNRLKHHIMIWLRFSFDWILIRYNLCTFIFNCIYYNCSCLSFTKKFIKTYLIYYHFSNHILKRHIKLKSPFYYTHWVWNFEVKLWKQLKFNFESKWHSCVPHVCVLCDSSNFPWLSFCSRIRGRKTEAPFRIRISGVVPVLVSIYNFYYNWDICDGFLKKILLICSNNKLQFILE